MAFVDEPTLAVDDIQGDILAGFRKDHVRLVFFQLAAELTPAFKSWLSRYSSQIATTRQVAGFNAVFKSMRVQMGREPAELTVLWRNIGFTSQGLGKLISAAELARFADASFQAGAEALSATLGDPGEGLIGSPSTWVVGSGAMTPDGVIVLAADSKPRLDQELADLTNALSPFLAAPVHVEVGETRAGRPGHEQFGFRDGISQPAPRGKLPDGSYFVTRYVDPGDPNAKYFAAPGQPLVWPGEFLLNGLKQKGANADPIEHRSVIDGPNWATNGSYLVFRRLRQDVRAFNAMVDRILSAMLADGAFPTATHDTVGAMLVGRFESGCPIMRSRQDNSRLAEDAYASNNFNFSTAAPPIRLAAGAPIGSDEFEAAPADRNGLVCPFGAHIRKVNPRDDSTDLGSGVNNLQRRILRRGIPYGPEFDSANPDDEDRGLLFLCYQASIERQFQALVADWANSPHAPKDPSGFDPIISTGPNRNLLVKRPDGTSLNILLPDPVVMATGAAFIFVPPVSALKGPLSE